MKRYDPAIDQCGEPIPVMELYDDGEYVKAEVVQALYDAVALVASHDGDDITVTDLRQMISRCKESLSLADGESE